MDIDLRIDEMKNSIRWSEVGDRAGRRLRPTSRGGTGRWEGGGDCRGLCYGARKGVLSSLSWHHRLGIGSEDTGLYGWW